MNQAVAKLRENLLELVRMKVKLIVEEGVYKETEGRMEDVMKNMAQSGPAVLITKNY